jgi:phosphoribosylformylglycinamidine cyclo-ligase
VPPLFRFIQARGNVDEKEMFRVFNMGVGMVLVVTPKLAGEVLAAVAGSWRLGRVITSSGSDRVILKG